MRSTTARVLVFAAMAAAIAVAGAQGGAPKSEETKISGMVRGATIKGKTFEIGARGGPFTIDATKAKITTKDGKDFDLSKLTGGSNVSAWGKMDGKSMKATKVQINYLRVPKPKTGG